MLSGVGDRTLPALLVEVYCVQIIWKASWQCLPEAEQMRLHIRPISWDVGNDTSSMYRVPRFDSWLCHWLQLPANGGLAEAMIQGLDFFQCYGKYWLSSGSWTFENEPANGGTLFLPLKYILKILNIFKPYHSEILLIGMYPAEICFYFTKNFHQDCHTTFQNSPLFTHIGRDKFWHNR